MIGDADGVVVVPASSAGEILAKCRKRIDEERDVIRRLRQGETTVSIMGLGKV